MIIYFAGAESKTLCDVLHQVKVQNILCSAYYMGFKKNPNEHKFKNYVLDSGGFTLRKFKKTVSVQEYIDYLNKWKVPLAFNLDTADVKETLENQRLLVENTDTKIIPIYHISDWTAKKTRHLLEDFCADFDYIAAAGVAVRHREMVREFYDYIFNITRDKVKVHGLAVTSQQRLADWPWYSVDSTSWISGGKFGTMKTFKAGKIHSVFGIRKCVTNDLPMTDINSAIEMLGPYEMLKVSIKGFLNLEAHTTELWKRRGVIWEPPQKQQA